MYVIHSALLLQTSYSNTVNSLCSESCVMARGVGRHVQMDIKNVFSMPKVVFIQAKAVSYSWVKMCVRLVVTKYRQVYETKEGKPYVNT